MLLAVTPSMLRDFGVNEHQLASFGSASIISPPDKREWMRGKKMPRTTGLRVYVVKDATYSARSHPRAATDIEDATALLSAEDMAVRMDCTRATVYEHEKKGLLFSVLPPGREKGRKFPAFQLHPRLDKELLHELIALYAERQAPLNLLWDFLRAVHSEFGGMTGLQVLLRTNPPASGVQTARVQALYAMPDAERREYVKDVVMEDLQHAFA